MEYSCRQRDQLEPPGEGLRSSVHVACATIAPLALRELATYSSALNRDSYSGKVTPRPFGTSFLLGFGSLSLRLARRRSAGKRKAATTFHRNLLSGS